MTSSFIGSESPEINFQYTVTETFRDRRGQSVRQEQIHSKTTKECQEFRLCMVRQWAQLLLSLLSNGMSKVSLDKKFCRAHHGV